MINLMEYGRYGNNAVTLFNYMNGKINKLNNRNRILLCRLYNSYIEIFKVRTVEMIRHKHIYWYTIKRHWI